jgi:hypothetical protein
MSDARVTAALQSQVNSLTAQLNDGDNDVPPWIIALRRSA